MTYNEITKTENETTNDELTIQELIQVSGGGSRFYEDGRILPNTL